MVSENPSGAGNQQGSRETGPVPVALTPQRLHAELLEGNRRIGLGSLSPGRTPGWNPEPPQCGRIHNPSLTVDPNYWRFYVPSAGHRRFMEVVGSWHPRKRLLVDTRMKI